ncbi:MAG: hypothetical protein IT426_17905 [Pirellulales bacterium]|nr:hypothetical protein [Pirellulales bacterium]
MIRRTTITFFLLLLAINGFHAAASEAETIWISAGDAVRLTGPISTGSGAGLLEENALGDS